MPFDPNFPFGPANPSQWWHTLDLLRNFVQSNSPASGVSGQTAGANGIDDWFVPGPTRSPPNHPDNGFVPSSVESDGFPDDWIYPDGRKAPPLAGAPNPAPQAPSSQSAAATPGISSRPAPRPDPFAAYWAMIPASRLDAFAWAPPDFSNFNPFLPGNSAASGWTTPSLGLLGQFPYAASAPPDIAAVTAGVGGLFGDIPKMLAERAKANDPWDSAPTGILGGIPKMVAASNAEARGLFGSWADLRPAASNAPADAPSWPGAHLFLSSDPDVFQDGSPPYGVVPVADKKSNSRNLDLLDQRAFGTKSPFGSPAPRLLPPLGRVGPPRLPPALPAPPAQPSAPLEGSSSVSPGQAASSPRASGTPSGPTPAGESEGNAGNRGGGAAARGIPSPVPVGEDGPPSPSVLEWREYERAKGSQQTILNTIFQGREITVRLDFPPDKDGIVDLKKYNWWKPGYVKPFLQGKVIEGFQTQIQKYQTLDPRVKFKFSEQPPPWVVEAIEQVGGAYIVEP